MVTFIKAQNTSADCLINVDELVEQSKEDVDLPTKTASVHMGILDRFVETVRKPTGTMFFLLTEAYHRSRFRSGIKPTDSLSSKAPNLVSTNYTRSQQSLQQPQLLLNTIDRPRIFVWSFDCEYCLVSFFRGKQYSLPHTTLSNLLTANRFTNFNSLRDSVILASDVGSISGGCCCLRGRTRIFAFYSCRRREISESQWRTSILRGRRWECLAFGGGRIASSKPNKTSF